MTEVDQRLEEAGIDPERLVPREATTSNQKDETEEDNPAFWKELNEEYLKNISTINQTLIQPEINKKQNDVPIPNIPSIQETSEKEEERAKIE